MMSTNNNRISSDIIIPQPSLWYPHLLENVDNWRYSDIESHQHSGGLLSHLHMKIIGHKSQETQALRRITALLDTRTGFHGFIFCYSSGHEILYGRRKVIDDDGTVRCCIEQSFIMNSEAKEAITGLEASFYNITATDRKFIKHIKVGFDSKASCPLCNDVS